MPNIESNLQINCVKWFKYQYPEYLIFSVPNGGYRTKTNAKILKAEGALAGVSDLVIVADGEVAFVEMKTENGRQQLTQKDFQVKVENLGHRYFICRSFDEFRENVEWFLKDE